MPSAPTPTIPSGSTGPTWEIAMFFPEQGDWTGEEYLEISERTNHFVELCDRRLEVHDMPGRAHQRIVADVHRALEGFAAANKSGEAILGPYPMKLTETTYREPDIVFMLTRNLERLGDRFAIGADLVVEVISKDRKRDLVDKRAEYALGGISEYWIIDPRDRCITVLTLWDGEYVESGRYEAGQRALSVLLKGFELSVEDILRHSAG